MSYGRRVIYSDATAITAENVAEEVRKAHLVHATNQAEIKKLHKIYRGETDILGKVKEIRESINHKINENRAWEIVNFYNGYLFGEPVQYVRRENVKKNDADDAVAADINALNGYMFSAGKAACDKRLGEWMLIAGVGYRLTLPNPKWEKDGDEPPFLMYSLKPEQTFVIRSTSVDERDLATVHVVKQESGDIVFSVYTDDYYYEFKEFGEVKSTPHTVGMNPIVEYPLEASRLGVFEVVVDLLNALNELQSNRMDDIVQFVNSFLAIFGAEMNQETRDRLEEWKMLFLPDGTDAKYLSANLNQADVQTLKNDILEAIITITGIPNRNGGSSTSDTGSAVIMRDGWQDAEARAKGVETMFKEAETKTLKLVLRILRDTVGTTLKLADIDTHFTRRNYENIASKSQVLVAMLNNPKIHPELAFAHCGMFPDPESAYLQSQAYYDEQMEKWNPVEVDETDEDDENVGGEGDV
jgi:SPP1 family phage portal protein